MRSRLLLSRIPLAVRRRSRIGLFPIAVALTALAAASLAGTARAWDGEMSLYAPATGETLSTTSPINFSWAASPYGDQARTMYGSVVAYQLHFQVASDATFASGSLLVDKTSTCYSPAGCPSSTGEGSFTPGVYYWRVTSSFDSCIAVLAAHGMLNSGTAVACQPKSSEVRSFTVAAPTAPTPTPRYPYGWVTPAKRTRSAAVKSPAVAEGRMGVNPPVTLR
jgi:hypothetical protein